MQGFSMHPGTIFTNYIRSKSKQPPKNNEIFIICIITAVFHSISKVN